MKESRVAEERKRISVKKIEERKEKIDKVANYYDKGIEIPEIAKIMNLPESTVRAWLITKDANYRTFCEIKDGC